MKNQRLPQIAGRDVTRIHAAGIGGMGVGPLAIYLAQRGWVVTGEDDAMSPRMLPQLERAGISIGTAGRASADLVVVSSAIKPDHAVRQTAAERGVTVRRRGEVLAAVAAEKKLLGIAGSHGKTTVTAMIVAALRASGVEPSFVLGGLWADARLAPAACTDSDWLVAEIDESDGTIAAFSPHLTVVVNLDWDHPDLYDDAAKLEQAFAELVIRTREVVLGPADGAMAQRLRAVQGGTATRETFGAKGGFLLQATQPIRAGLQLTLGRNFSKSTATVAAWGAFNAMNATAALAALQLMKVEWPPTALSNFPGVHRRQAVLHEDGELIGLEDYAHHPTEVGALLREVRRRMPVRDRLVVVFQPHRYSRTLQFKTEFAEALRPADVLHLREVYAAGEAPLAGGHTADLAAQIAATVPDLPVEFIPGDGVEAERALRTGCQPGDWVIFVGAGDIEDEAHRWAVRQKSSNASRDNWSEIVEILRLRLSEGAKVKADEPMANKTTMRVGGAARVYVEPASVADLQEVLRQAHQRDLLVYMLGRGSNLLVPDSGVAGVVVSLRKSVWETFAVLGDSRVRVGAGLRLKNLCGLAAKVGLAGFEFLEGIPGNVGGALRMNAGAMGGWMFDVVESVEALSLAGERLEFRREDLHAGYRHCRELEQAVAIAAVLKPREVSAAEQVGRQIDVYRSKRQESQPREPSAGCIFKNPEGDSAGRLIDAAGLKGSRIGDAEVSTVHANFIVNRGQATSTDVVQLVRHVRAEVKQKSGVDLQPEVLLYGAKWEDLL